jgi:holo-[acyl-carrier protein] synthase
VAEGRCRDDRVRVSVGVDLVPVARIARLLDEHTNAERELFTAAERAYCRRRRRAQEHLAARFAAKEAVLKSLGTGMTNRMRWTDVEVVSARSGKPRIRLDGAVASLAERNGLAGLEVSLSHAAGLALAQAVAVWGEEGGRDDALPPDR